MNPQRIALFQPYPHTLGGLQAVVASLARALPAHGCVPVLVVPEEGKFSAAMRAGGLECLVCDPGPAWHGYGRGARSLSYAVSPRRLVELVRYWWRLGRQLKAWRIDLLHCNDYRGVFLAAPAARCAGLPVLWHMHGFIPSRLANLAAGALVDWIVPVSAGMLDYLPVPRSWRRKITVIHNGLEAGGADPARAMAAAEPPVVLAVGTLHPRKGYETLIRAFAEVVTRVPDAQCWIAGGKFGDDSYERSLRELVVALGLGGHLHFLGSSDQVPELMRRAALLAVPSQIEAFGMVAIEAMRARLPVVASRTGGLSEIVVPEETGFLVAPGDAHAMAAALLRLLHDPALARRLGEAGHARGAAEFTLEKMTANFAALYSRLLARRAGTAPSPLRPGQTPASGGVAGCQARAYQTSPSQNQ